jgi:hypothetical protein
MVLTSAERLVLTWGVFKALAIKAKGGRAGAAAFLRLCLAELEAGALAESRDADEQRARILGSPTNVVSLR